MPFPFALGVATAAACLCAGSALADCGAVWPPGSMVVSAGGDSANLSTTKADDGGVLFKAADAALPSQLPVDKLLQALGDARLATVQAGAIRIEAALDVSRAGGRRRLNLSTDLGAGAVGPIVLAQRITLGASDRIYLRGAAVEQCFGSSNSEALHGGHVAIFTNFGGVGQDSEPLRQLNVAGLSGFSLLTLNTAKATIVSAGRLPLEEFDHGRADSQNAIFTNGPLQIERTR